MKKKSNVIAVSVIILSLFLFLHCSDDTSNSKKGPVNEGPVIDSFTATYETIYLYDSTRSFTPLRVAASDDDGEIVSYSFEIVSDTAVLPVFWMIVMSLEIQ